ncbi:MAG TPA: hypothetical protein VGG19_13590 [Tepidisphaeraceae bacterium]|jgi:hypothetical protein
MDSEVKEFPSGFQGWSIIVWGVPDYPLLPKVSGKIIERFPADGIIITSSTAQYGVASEEYYYIDANGQKLPLRPIVGFGTDGSIVDGNRRMDFRQLFIGPRSSMRTVGPSSCESQAQDLYQRLYPRRSMAAATHP